jgi:AcrR family transcriptional regulator
MPKVKASMERRSPRQPIQARGIMTRKKIMNAGRKIFILHGFHNVLADDIAREAGVSVGSFYGYFKDKRSLLQAILEQSSNEMLENAQKQLSPLLDHDPANTKTIIANTLVMLMDLHQATYPMYQEAQQIAIFDKEMRSYILKSEKSTLDIFETMLFRLNPHLDKQTLHAAAHIVFHASEGIVHGMVINPDAETSKKDIIKEGVKLFLGYLQTLQSAS